MDDWRLRPLGVLAGSVIAVRAAAGVSSFTPALDAVYDAVLVVLSLAITADTVPSVVGKFAIWIFYSGVFYRLLPELFPEQLDVFATDRRLISLLSVLSVGVGAVLFSPWVNAAVALIENPEQNIDVSTGASIQSVLLFLIFVVPVVGTYFALRYGDPFDPESDLYTLIASFEKNYAQRATKYREVGGRLAYLGRGLTYMGLGATFGGLCFFLGGLTVMLAGFSPVPELLVIIAVMLTYIPVSKPLPSPPDIESDIQKTTRVALRNQKGAWAMFLFIVGVFQTFVFLGYGIVLIRAEVGFLRTLDLFANIRYIESWTLLFTELLQRLTHDLASIGAGVLILLGGILYFWYWKRLGKRLPAYVKAWEGIDTTTPSVTRPPWSVTVPMILVGIGTTVQRVLLSSYSDGLGLLLCLLGLVVAGYWVYITHQREPQPATSDWFAPPLALGLVIPLTFYVSVVGFGVEIPVGHMMDFGIVVLALSLLFFVPDINKYFDSKRLNKVPVKTGGAILLFIIITPVIVRQTGGSDSILISMIGVLLFLLAILAYAIYSKYRFE